MKKIVFVLMLISLSGCVYRDNYSVSQIDKNFELKQECSKLIDKEKDIIEIYNTENTPYNNLSLLEIFYSPKKNTCIEGFVRITKTELIENKPTIFTAYVLKDLIENKELKAFDLKVDYDKEVESLK